MNITLALQFLKSLVTICSSESLVAQYQSHNAHNQDGGQRRGHVTCCVAKIARADAHISGNIAERIGDDA